VAGEKLSAKGYSNLYQNRCGQMMGPVTCCWE